MRVEVLYKLHPPSVFGLPGDDYTVIPGGEDGIKDVVGPTIDTLTGSVVGLGTLSQYRRFDERLSLRLEREGVGVQLVDDYVTLTLDIDGRSLDLEKCESLIESLCLWLTHFASTPAFAEPLQAVIPETQRVKSNGSARTCAISQVLHTIVWAGLTRPSCLRIAVGQAA